MENSTFQQPVSQFNYSTPQKRKSKKLLYIILFLIILVLIFFAAQKLFLGKKTQEKIPATTPTPTEYQFPTDTPAVTPKEKVSETPAASPTTKAINPIDSKTGLDRSKLNVEVQNGSGEVGAASKGSDVLKGFGYKVVATGNAGNFNYENVTVQIKSTKSNFLDLLKKDLGFSYTVGSSSADLSSSSTSDALVIIGK